MYTLQNDSRSIQSMYIICPEDKQVKKQLNREIHSRQERGQLDFQVLSPQECYQHCHYNIS